MAKKTWFLPPDFTLLPDGEIRLGMILKHPDRPTLALDSLDALDFGNTTKLLPEQTSVIETSHLHSTDSNSSTSFGVLTKFLELAAISGKADTGRFKDLSFGQVDHEVRMFKRALNPEALRAVVKLDSVKKYMNGGPFGRYRQRPIYIVSGLRVARSSFSIKNTANSRSAAEASLSGIGAALGTHVPVEVNANVANSEEEHKSVGYNTAPGIVFAYRLHVISGKRDGTVESELFSDTAAFVTGHADSEDEEEEEITFTEATPRQIKNATEIILPMTEYVVGDENIIAFSTM